MTNTTIGIPMKKLVVLALALGLALMFGGQAVHAKPAPFLEAELTYPDCHHLVSSVRWSHPTVAHTVEHIFAHPLAGGGISIDFIVNEPVVRVKNRGTSEVMYHRLVNTGEEWLMAVRLKDENGVRFFSASSPVITIGPCPGH